MQVVRARRAFMYAESAPKAGDLGRCRPQKGPGPPRVAGPVTDDYVNSILRMRNGDSTTMRGGP